MLSMLHVVGGAAAVGLSVYMMGVGRAEGEKVRPFLRNEFVRAGYIMAILALFFWGSAWVIATAVSLP